MPLEDMFHRTTMCQQAVLQSRLGKADLVPSDLFLTIGVNPRAQGLGDQLCAQADSQYRDALLDGRANQLRFCSEVRISTDLVDVHRSPKDDQAQNAVQARPSIGVATKVHALDPETPLPDGCRQGAESFVIDMLEHEHSFHGSAATSFGRSGRQGCDAGAGVKLRLVRLRRMDGGDGMRLPVVLPELIVCPACQVDEQSGLLASAPNRCPHRPQCVGCALLGRPYAEQLTIKRQAVVQATARYPSLAGLVVPEVVGAPQSFGYRSQAKLVARRARRGLLLGLYRPGTHQVVDISQCPVHHPLINRVLARLRLLFEQMRVPVYDERTATGWLRYVVVRVSRWQRTAQVILVARDREWAGLRALARRVRRIGGVRSVALNINPTPGNVIFGERSYLLAGEAALVERVGGLKLMSRPGSFLQANIPAARRVYARALEWAAPQATETALDLFCGVGAFSFCLATSAGSVWGIEESGQAVLDAKHNIRRNGFHNLRFLAGEAAVRTRELAAELGRIDLVALNPPRKGADEATREAIAAAAPSRIVYISCCPVTLARDLDWFAAHRYVPVRLQPFDMLPQTDHVETVALLIRNGEAGAASATLPTAEP